MPHSDTYQTNATPAVPQLPLESGQPQPDALRNLARPEGKAKNPIKVLLVDDHPVVRKGISACLSRQPNLQVVGEASDGREALRKAKILLPDIILMDIDMPLMSGLTVTEVLRKELPHIKVLVLSMFSNTEYVVRMLRAGARGYVLKEAPIEDLVKAIEAINAGEAFFSPDVAGAALNRFVRGDEAATKCPQLTNREREVVTRIAEGLSNKEIAHCLGVGVRTVETHRERIMRKLGIHSIAGLTRFAIAHGLISLPEAESYKPAEKLPAPRSRA